MAAVGLAYIEKRALDLPRDKELALSEWANEYFCHIENTGAQGVWRHVPVTEMFHTDAFVGGNGVKPLAAQYIEFDPNLQEKNTDWLVADTLCFAEVNATLVAFGKMKGGKQANPLSLKIITGVWKLFVWALWIAIVAFAFVVTPWAGWALVGLTVFVQAAKIRGAVARNRLIMEMISTYQALASTTFSWAILWDHMAKSRELGAVWPPELYRLVEIKMSR